MKLIPYQVKLLNEEYNRNNEERQSLINAEKARIGGLTIHAGEGESYDDQNHIERDRLVEKNATIMRILDSASIITDYNEEQISVGSTFTVCFIDEMEEETFTLIEQKVSTEGSATGFITLNSDFGTAVHRKKLNEIYAYITTNGSLMSGIITKIFTKEEQKEYFAAKNKSYQKIK